MARRLVRLDDLDILEQPFLAAQRRIGGVDAPEEMIPRIEAQQNDAVEPGVVLVHAAGVQDIAFLIRRLTQP